MAKKKIIESTMTNEQLTGKYITSDGEQLEVTEIKAANAIYVQGDNKPAAMPKTELERLVKFKRLTKI